MSPQEHVWACALARDGEGIAMWKAIAACLDALIKGHKAIESAAYLVR